jgi:fucose 4-O-acetylase-like acetyltransferase
MVSIVYIHSDLLIGTTGGRWPYLQLLIMQLFKFGTICFFLISGYLLGEGISKQSPMQYFLRRFRAVFLPWLFWGMAWVGVNLLIKLHHSTAHTLVGSFGSVLHQYLHLVFFDSIYWFVPNFCLSLALLLALYKRVNDVLLGSTFLACSLFYGVNIYLGLVPVSHPTALLGFVFYLWLGVFAFNHSKRLNSWLNRVSWFAILACMAGALTVALLEFHGLWRHGSDAAAANTLRLSNQLFSVLMALVIAKWKRPIAPGFINVRTETFGIYLLHPILLDGLKSARSHIVRTSEWGFSASAPRTMLMVVAVFVVVYLGSLFLTKQIGKIPFLRWSVGK